jgi:hypothetical protein
MYFVNMYFIGTKMNIMKIIIIWSLACHGGMQAMDDSFPESNTRASKGNAQTTQEQQKKNNSSVYALIKKAVIGGVAGSAEIVLNQPLIYFKNTSQRGEPIEWLSPKVWYRGLGMSISAMGPTTAFQTATDAALESVMPGNDTSTAISRAFIAGVASATLCAPIDLVILDQQKNNGSVPETFRRLVAEAGWRVLVRGWAATALREGPWSVAYLVGFPIAQEVIKNQIDNPVIANIGAYVGAGALTGSAVAVLTQPIDTIKTCMQADYQRTTVKTMRDTVRALYATRGFKGFFSGVAARTINCGLAVPLISTLNRYLSKKADEFN